MRILLCSIWMKDEKRTKSLREASNYVEKEIVEKEQENIQFLTP